MTKWEDQERRIYCAQHNRNNCRHSPHETEMGWAWPYFVALAVFVVAALIFASGAGR